MTPGRRPAAVLVPVYEGPHGPTLILIRRVATGLHAGQVAFPGGRPEPADKDLEATALREAYEELGIEPSGVQVIGRLPVVETMTSNYAISAFVGRVVPADGQAHGRACAPGQSLARREGAARPALRPQASEVAAVLDVPVSALLAPGLPLEEDWELPLPGEPLPRAVAPAAAVAPPRQVRRVRYFPLGEDRIWGATARMIEHLLAALRAGTLRL